MFEKLRRLLHTIEENRYFNGYADYPGVGKIYDKDVARYAAKHLRWYDRFDIRKVTEAVLYSQMILMGVAKPEEFGNDEHWKF